MNSQTNILLAIVISLLILVAQTGYWYNKYIINPTNFQKTLSEGILNDESKHAFAKEIVDQGLSKRPIAKEILDEPAQSVIYSLLGTQFFDTTINRLTTRIHERLTTPQKPDFSIELTRLKTYVVPIIERLNPDLGQKITAKDIPDKIVVIRPNYIPSFYNQGTFILWSSWISFILLFPLGIYYFYANKNRSKALETLGIVLTIISALSIVLLITSIPLFLSGITSSNIHIIAENVLQSFFSTLMRQILFIAGLGIILYVLGFFYQRFVKKGEQHAKL